MVATVKIMTLTSPIGTLDLVASMLAATLYQGNILRDIYSICRWCWNVATYKNYVLLAVQYCKSIAGKTVERKQHTYKYYR